MLLAQDSEDYCSRARGCRVQEHQSARCHWPVVSNVVCSTSPPLHLFIFFPPVFFFFAFFLCASRFFVMRLRHFLELVFEFFVVLCKPWFHYPDCVVDRKAHFAQSHRPLSTGPFSVRAFMSGCFVCNNSQVLYRRVNCL